MQIGLIENTSEPFAGGERIGAAGKRRLYGRIEQTQAKQRQIDEEGGKGKFVLRHLTQTETKKSPSVFLI